MKAAAGRWAGIFVIATLQFYWYYLPAPLAMKVLTAVFTAVCVASPQHGFMLLALVAPVSTTLSWRLGGLEPGGFLLEQLVLGVCIGALVKSPAGPQTRLGAPAAVMAVVAVASALALAPASAAATAPAGLDIGEGAFWRQLLDRHAAVNSAVWAPVFAALIVAESCLLCWVAEREMRRAPSLATQLLWLLLIGHAVQALLSFDHVIQSALTAGGGLRALGYALLNDRFSVQTDVHAAGSALVLAAVAGSGLVAGSRGRRGSALLLVAIVTAGLWISGSRLAIAASAAAGAIALVWWGLRSSRRRAVIATAATVTVLATGWCVVVQKTRYNTISISVRTRVMMAETSMRLFSSAPVFGIGVHQFYPASERALDPEFQALSRSSRENAHNNFLQILAEQGVVGLTAMLWWLGLLCAGAWSATKRDGPSRERSALFLGLLACVGTWLGGHPLLVREFSTVFFLYAAMLAAITPAVTVVSARLAAAVVAIVALTVPARAMLQRNAVDLQDLGFGLSRWTRDTEYRYREAGAEFHVYLPTGISVQLPLRLVGEEPATALAEVHLGGRVAHEMRIGPDQWRLLDVEVPHSSKKFELARVTIRLDGSPERQGPVVLVGRVIPR